MTSNVVVAVFDSATQAYSRPFFVPTRNFAVRSFTDEVNRNAADNPMFAHSDDYELRFLCEWDDESGVFDKGDIVCLVRAKDVKRVD